MRTLAAVALIISACAEEMPEPGETTAAITAACDGLEHNAPCNPGAFTTDECDGVCRHDATGALVCTSLTSLGLAANALDGRLCGDPTSNDCGYTGQTCSGGACVDESGAWLPVAAGTACRTSNTANRCAGSCSGWPLGICTAVTAPCPYGRGAAGASTNCEFDTCGSDAVDCETVTLPDTSACDDGIACLTGETCSAGVCGGGSIGSGCFIDSLCWTDGDLNPADVCEECNPAVSAIDWTGIAGCVPPDAGPGVPDAAPGVPDAAPGVPDAAPGVPDALPAPDAAPDAPPATPDAATVPDAASMPDGPQADASGDAATPDASPDDGAPGDAASNDGATADAATSDAEEAPDAPRANAIDLGGGGCDCRAGRSGGGDGGVTTIAFVIALAWFLRRRGLVALFALAILAGSARDGLADGFDAQIHQPTTSTTGYFSQPGATLLGHRRLSFGVAADFGRDLLVARDLVTGETLRDGKIVEQRVTSHIVAGLGLFDRLEVGLAMPIVLTQDGNLAQVAPGEDLSGTVLGDARLFAKVKLTRLDSLHVHATLDATIPTGDADAFAGAGSLTARPGLVVGVVAGRIDAAVNLGYRLRGRRELANVAIDDEITAGAGISFAVTPTVRLLGEAYAMNVVDGGDNDLPVEAIVGMRASFGRLVFQVGGGFGLTRGAGAPSRRGLITLAYAAEEPSRAAALVTPPVREPDRDSDGDGLFDAADRCPDEAEDPDTWEDGDGCPEADNDGDSVVDASDSCPIVKGPVENRGCPDADGDGDGLVDRVDGCPDQAEDVDGRNDDDGCPDPDNDADGVADAIDLCDDDPEDLDNVDDLDGCPDLDNDKDGLVDDLDSCPNEAEIFNGNQDEDGCPDKGKMLAVFTPEKIEIKEQVLFSTGKAKIKKQSFKLLAAVAKILFLHPEVAKLRIEGHTDSRGKRAKNVKLSQDRADAVRKHLIDVNGIDAGRLEAIGFGPDQPIADNKTKAGQAANRRVEFVVVPEPAAPAPAP